MQDITAEFWQLLRSWYSFVQICVQKCVWRELQIDSIHEWILCHRLNLLACKQRKYLWIPVLEQKYEVRNRLQCTFWSVLCLCRRVYRYVMHPRRELKISAFYNYVPQIKFNHQQEICNSNLWGASAWLTTTLKKNSRFLSKSYTAVRTRIISSEKDSCVWLEGGTLRYSAFHSSYTPYPVNITKNPYTPEGKAPLIFKWIEIRWKYYMHLHQFHLKVGR